MGNTATKQAKCVMLGLDCAGKTSILETSKKTGTGIKQTTPTIGMNIEVGQSYFI